MFKSISQLPFLDGSQKLFFEFIFGKQQFSNSSPTIKVNNAIRYTFAIVNFLFMEMRKKVIRKCNCLSKNPRIWRLECKTTHRHGGPLGLLLHITTKNFWLEKKDNIVLVSLIYSILSDLLPFLHLIHSNHVSSFCSIWHI